MPDGFGSGRWRRIGSRGLATAMTATLTAGLLAVTAQPAAAVGYHYEENSSWAYTDAHRPSKIYVDGAGDVPVGSWLDDRNRKHTARAYFTFDITRFRGTTVNSVTFSAEETSVTDCAQRPPVELWRTAPVNPAKSSWKKPPAQRRCSTPARRPPTAARGHASSGTPSLVCARPSPRAPRP